MVRDLGALAHEVSGDGGTEEGAASNEALFLFEVIFKFSWKMYSLIVD